MPIISQLRSLSGSSLCSGSLKAKIKMMVDLSDLVGRVCLQAHSGCWKNLIPCLTKMRPYFPGWGEGILRFGKLPTFPGSWHLRPENQQQCLCACGFPFSLFSLVSATERPVWGVCVFYDYMCVHVFVHMCKFVHV